MGIRTRGQKNLAGDDQLVQLSYEGPATPKHQETRKSRVKDHKILTPSRKPLEPDIGKVPNSSNTKTETETKEGTSLGAIASLTLIGGSVLATIYSARPHVSEWANATQTADDCVYETMTSTVASFFTFLSSVFSKQFPPALVLPSTDPITLCLALCSVIALGCFVVSFISGNVSQVDKLWSVTPFLYAWVCVCDDRTRLMALVATFWGVRLTGNFNRRGGYQWPPWEGEEDYRWKPLREGNVPYLTCLKNPVPWQIFNLVFISFYQHILLMLTAIPTWVAATAVKCGTAAPLGNLDCLAAFLFVLFVCIEWRADNEQYEFQTEKYKQINAGKELTGKFKDGFNTGGLFSFVRKPNYSAEQHIWVVYYLFSVAATGQWINYSVIGCVLLIALFQGSGWLTETLTIRRYPEYTKYQARVPLYFPYFNAVRGLYFAVVHM